MADDLPDFQGTLGRDQLLALVAAIRDLREQVAAGQGAQLDNANDPAVDEYTDVFPAEITGNGSNGTVFTWKEKTNVGGAIADLGTPSTDGRGCSNASHASAAIEMNGATYIPTGTEVLMYEVPDGADHRFMFSHTVACFTITGVSGSANATNWSPYSTSQGASIWNTFEPCTTATMGTTINANGTVGSSACALKAIGNITMPCQWNKAASKWQFAQANNAG